MRLGRMGAMALAACTLQCASSSFVTAAPVADEKPTPRHPDGVLLDPPPALPPAVEHAQAHGVVGLREPLAEAEARNAVLAYVNAFINRDVQALERMLTPDAKQLFSHGAGSSSSLVEFWRQRLRNFDYAKLANVEVVRADQIERYDYDELGGAGERPRPGEMHPGDVLVRAPVATPRLNGDRLFGDIIVLLLRWDEGRATGDRGYKIAGFSEEEAP
jgi:hypothetical protein